MLGCFYFCAHVLSFRTQECLWVGYVSDIHLAGVIIADINKPLVVTPHASCVLCVVIATWKEILEGTGQDQQICTTLLLKAKQTWSNFFLPAPLPQISLIYIYISLCLVTVRSRLGCLLSCEITNLSQKIWELILRL